MSHCTDGGNADGPADQARTRGAAPGQPTRPRAQWHRLMGALAAGAFTYAALLVCAYAVRPRLVVDLTGDARAATRGVYAAEHAGGLTWAWTRPQAEVSIATLDRRMSWTWTGRVLLNRASSASVRIAVDGLVVAERLVTHNHQLLEVEVPHRFTGAGATLSFTTSPGFVPGGGDTRELGIAFESMSLAPSTGRPLPPAATLLAGSIAIMAVGAALAVMRLSVGWLLACLMLVAGGQAWLLTRGGAAYGPYPVRTVAAGIGLWLGWMLFLRAVDRLPAAWAARASYLPPLGLSVGRLIGPVAGTGGIRGWLNRPRMRRLVSGARHVGRVGAYTLPVLLVCHALAFWGHGIIDREAMAFVLNYLADRPLLATLFDPKLNDWGTYQARELSYFFDFVDAHVFAALLDRDLLLFIPLSGAAGIVMIPAVYFWGATRLLRVDAVSAALFVSLYLSCIVTQASTAILYRSSKITLSVAFLAMLFLVTLLIRPAGGQQRVSSAKLAGVFGLGIAMSTCDRQGFFLLAAATIIVALLWLTARVRRAPARGHHAAVIAAGAGALGVAALYNYVLAPAVVLWANGYSPSFEYQRLPLGDLSRPAVLAQAWELFQAETSYFFGNVPFWVVVTFVVVGWIAAVWPSRASGRRRSTARTLLTDDILVVLCASCGAMVAMFALMILRHPAVFSIPDHRLWYYWTPMHVAILFGATLWVSTLSEPGRLRGKAVVYTLVLFMIAGNVAHYDRQRAVMVNSERWFKHQYERSRRLVSAFADMRGGEGRDTGIDRTPGARPANITDVRHATERQYLESVRAAVSRKRTGME